MFCSHCGSEIKDGAAFCPKCGKPMKEAAPAASMQAAPQVQPANNSYQSNPNPGYTYTPNPGSQDPYNNPQQPPRKSSRSKVAAGLLGIFLGGFGVHNFYLGKTSRGVAQIIVSLVTCGVGSIWGFIEGILCLCGNYTDVDGLPLSD